MGPRETFQPEGSGAMRRLHSYPKRTRGAPMSVTRRQAALGLALLATGGLVAATGGFAADPHKTTVVKSAHNAKQNKNIVVNPHGIALYRMTSDTAGNSKCTHKLVNGLD